MTQHAKSRVDALVDQARRALARGDAVAAERVVLGAISRQAMPGAQACHIAGVLARRRGDAAAAERRLRAGLAVHPSERDLAYAVGNGDLAAGRLPVAAAWFRHATAIDPAFASGHHNIGRTDELADRPAAAADHYRRALVLAPEMAIAYANLGNQWAKTEGAAPDAMRAALDQFRRGRAAGHADAIPLTGIATALKRLYAFDGGRRAARAAICLRPGDGGLYYNLGNLERDAAVPIAAARAHARALVIRPDHGDTNWNRSHALLLAGAFETGFAAYEWRWRASGFPGTPPSPGSPRWHGETLLHGTLYVAGEQGFGDMIQMLRYVRALRERVGRVVLSVPAPLVRLAAHSLPGAAVIADDEPIPAHDAHVPLMSLPHDLGTALDSIPAHIPYLVSPDAPPALPGREDDRARPAVGLVWAGNPQHRRDHERSIRPDLLAPLLAVDHVDWYALDKAMGPLPVGPITQLGDRLGDFADTAALLDALDLVITVDTSIAHLAGALGRPTWLALPFSPDWRWLLGRTDSPWYPTMRLFRQERPNDWRPVIAAVIAALRARAA
jgi:tetratricopeptide (TPR) repeat protein